jgi:energy-coupling factor transporter ATP-binding protein EcfA2
MSKKSTTPCLQVSHLGPIQSADIQFGNLTVLVGPQASGKSILLQTLKLVLDHRSVSSTLRREGYDWQGKREQFAELFFGEGMENVWSEKTAVTWSGKPISLATMAQSRIRSDSNDSLFYIPAHRVLTLKNGWPRHFGDYTPGDPYVVQDFSERLRMLMEAGLGRGTAIFPQGGRLTEATRSLLKRGIFGDYELKQELSGLQKRLVLQRGKERSLPFMVWSAGQREFSPLLLGLYHLMPSGKVSRRKGVDWVVLEEPEMGLHPRAITAVLFLVLELLHRGYRVCISTHSPHVLDLLWAIRVLIERKAGPEWILKLFDISNLPRNREIAASILKQEIRVHYLDREEEVSKDISRLDPESDSPHETNWGGLIEFSARTADVVADFVANHS